MKQVYCLKYSSKEADIRTIITDANPSTREELTQVLKKRRDDDGEVVGEKAIARAHSFVEQNLYNLTRLSNESTKEHVAREKAFKAEGFAVCDPLQHKLLVELQEYHLHFLPESTSKTRRGEKVLFNAGWVHSAGRGGRILTIKDEAEGDSQGDVRKKKMQKEDLDEGVYYVNDLNHLEEAQKANLRRVLKELKIEVASRSGRNPRTLKSVSFMLAGDEAHEHPQKWHQDTLAFSFPAAIVYMTKSQATQYASYEQISWSQKSAESKYRYQTGAWSHVTTSKTTGSRGGGKVLRSDGNVEVDTTKFRSAGIVDPGSVLMSDTNHIHRQPYTRREIRRTVFLPFYTKSALGKRAREEPVLNASSWQPEVVEGSCPSRECERRLKIVNTQAAAASAAEDEEGGGGDDEDGEDDEDDEEAVEAEEEDRPAEEETQLKAEAAAKK